MSLPILCSFSFLAIAVTDDLCFRKFHNWLFITLSLIGFLMIGFEILPLSFYQATTGFLVGGLLMLPLVLTGVVGAGDMKFFMCFGVIMGMTSLFEIFVFSLFWGALIGVLQTLFSGHVKSLVQNLKLMRLKIKPMTLHKIPYTVAIFFGWLTLQSGWSLL